MKQRLICAVCLAALLALLAGCGVTAQTTTPPTATPDPTPTIEPTPEPAAQLSFSTVDAEGNEWTEASLAGAKLTMLNFWAYWCGPCMRELPDLQKLSEDYAGRGLRVLGVGEAAEETQNLAAMAENGVEYPCLRYVEAFDPYLNTGYVPTTMFLDERGCVVGESVIGSRSYEDWAKLVEELLLSTGDR